MTTTITLTATQEEILRAAAERPDGTLYPLPQHVIDGGLAALSVLDELEMAGLVNDETLYPPFKNLCINDKGRQAIGIDLDQLTEMERREEPGSYTTYKLCGEPHNL